ncbi:hypothetical protein Glove_1066g6 [Diversispora epigaea]|uniref:Uncharacterized protein n=1 Tax=Diversispora epigaea TaxID=1348612 RepID=A0A397G2F3_9GLOM|nr:hypothetical protein Glove_1066g6 [Diversispora epigaea]
MGALCEKLGHTKNMKINQKIPMGALCEKLGHTKNMWIQGDNFDPHNGIKADTKNKVKDPLHGNKFAKYISLLHG